MELLTAKQVTTLTTLSRMTIWRYIQAGTFPNCIKLGPKRVDWRRKDVMAWLESRQPVQR
ncbi:helix-turn-helix transcriptional regulator [Escherichia coli]|uniref:helix-turn-helix transcriptional regulator n=1 Tax=Escherichia coli TaxID=562 RepID=UPI0003A34900|nr:AlpA family phage regulatory protein [Escherichia coli]